MANLLFRLDSWARQADFAVAANLSSFVPNAPSLDALLFHPVFAHRAEITQQLVSPFEKFTLDRFRCLIEFYLAENYQFVSPLDIQNGLDPNRRYVWLTFDDGYANNLRLVPLLKEYNVCATFFIATNHVLQNKPFWWDIVMHFRAKKGIPRLRTLQERNYLKTLRHNQIDDYLLDEFGPEAFKPNNDLDRPMTASELSDFAHEYGVHIGNHTHDHAILTNYDSDGITEQIELCQAALKNLIGMPAISISYPDGAFSDLVVEQAIAAGIQIGVTTQAKRNKPPPTNPEALMRIARPSLSGDFNIRYQCQALRINFSPLQKLRGFALKRYQLLQPKLGKS